MSYELDNLKREVDHIKYSIHLKTDNEDYRRLKDEVQHLKSELQSAKRELYDLQDRLTQHEYSHPINHD